MSQVIFLIISLLIVFIYPSSALAAETCSGVVTNERPEPINGVRIDLYAGIMSQIKQTTTTDSQGRYTFTVVAFGSGAIPTNKVVFSTAGYQDKIFDYTNGGSCPGNVTLNSTGSTGYICDKGQCKVVSGDSKFADEASCKNDCGIYRYDSGRGFCIPDPNGNIYSLKECQEQTPVTGGDKYKYNPPTNTCVIDTSGGGKSWEECQKEVKAALVGSQNCGGSGQPACTSAAGDMCDANRIRTAIGCVPTEPTALIRGLMKVFAGAGGGIALLLMSFGAIQMITSQGSPEGIKTGQERFTSAALGLLFIIFSVLLLEIIGVNILGLNQLGVNISR